MTTHQEADPYLRIVDFFDKDETAGAFLREDGDGGFAGAVYRMAREIDRLRAPALAPSDNGLVEQWRALEEGEPRTSWYPRENMAGDRAGWEALAKRAPDKYTIETRKLVPAAALTASQADRTALAAENAALIHDNERYVKQAAELATENERLRDLLKLQVHKRREDNARAASLQTLLDKAMGDIAAERRRQIEAEGWTPEHDDVEHDSGDLAAAASAYALHAADMLNPYSQGDGRDLIPDFWPFSKKWWKPTDARRDLVKAGALIAAEIDRIDRATAIQEARQ